MLNPSTGKPPKLDIQDKNSLVVVVKNTAGGQQLNKLLMNLYLLH